MKTAPLADVKTHLSRFLDECQDEPIVVTRNGRPIAMLVPVSDGEDLERLILSCSPRFRRLLEAADRRAQGNAGLSHEAFWRKVEAPAAKAPGRKRRASRG